ncbi:DegQ family serine endoprotease [Vulgatibacter incomptus]|uniref:HtrA protease/chaperone protein n=1 Tax=Vulgatibacter incomptus TaxID=1391653 RepID=A0A0K1PDV8_9BACT|nr:DegQ family serine endoprotease [Vulgatibacter incomptus]AKU91606.1 HtrA protease/chaperone protein [Vulgatibacter incomptus]
MSSFARGLFIGAAGCAALAASLAVVSPISFEGSTAHAKGRSELWHEYGDGRPSPAIPNGFSPLPSLAPLVKTLKPAVVSVSTASVVRSRRRGGPDPFEEFFRRFMGEQGQRDGAGPAPAPRGQGERIMPRSMGSGFILHESGLVLTNNHVIDGADQIEVKLADGREFKAQVVGSDPKTDVALLRLENAKDLPAVMLGDSDAAEVGDWVVAIGNPFGLSHSVSMGIVSAKERFIGAGPYDDFIQTDAAINPGNSGGPLFNSRGEVIGINTAIVAQGQGIGFAVPINLVKALVPQLEGKGHVSRGWLGVATQDLTAELAKGLSLGKQHGALVADVVPGSPAEAAGVRPGDVIVSVDGRTIETYAQLSRTVAFLSPGTRIALGVMREGKQQRLDVTISERTDDEMAARPRSKSPAGEADPLLGLTVGEVTAETARSLGIARGGGVVVTDVQPGSAAARAGVAANDVLLEVNRRPVRSLPEYRDAVRSIGSGEMILLRIQRGDSAIYLAVRPG